MSILIAFLFMIPLFLITVALVFLSGYTYDKVERFVDGLDGEIGENDGPTIIEEFTIPEDDEELTKFKKQMIEDYEKEFQEFVVEDMKDGVLGNLKREKF